MEFVSIYVSTNLSMFQLCSYFLILWNKFILLKNIEPTTKNIRQIPPIKLFLRSIRLKSHATKQLFTELKKSYSKLPDSKDILNKLDKLQEKKNTLMQEYSSTKSTMDELYQIRKNYGTYMDKEMER